MELSAARVLHSPSLHQGIQRLTPWSRNQFASLAVGGRPTLGEGVVMKPQS